MDCDQSSTPQVNEDGLGMSCLLQREDIEEITGEKNSEIPGEHEENCWRSLGDI